MTSHGDKERRIETARDDDEFDARPDPIADGKQVERLAVEALGSRTRDLEISFVEPGLGRARGDDRSSALDRARPPARSVMAPRGAFPGAMMAPVGGAVAGAELRRGRHGDRGRR